MTRLAHSARTLGAMGLLGLALPVNAALTTTALVRGWARPAASADPRRSSPSRPRTVMVSGGKMTKALALCRAFHAAGHRVVLVESARYRLTGHRFSRAVDAFHTIPDAGSPDYADALEAIVRAEGVDVYVPVCSPASSIADARAKKQLEQVCEVVHLDPDRLELVDDKFRFARAAAAAGLGVPDTHLVTDAQQVLDHDFSGATRPYILKSIAYDPVHRLDLTRLPHRDMEAFVRSLPISEANPWILQEFVEGTEYCTHSTVRDGRLTVYCCCESSAFQVNYDHVEHPGIRAWVDTFVGEAGLTGQVSLDFIVDEHDEVFAIECNPRTHSAITLLHDHPGVAAAYLEDDPDAEVVVPTAAGRPTYWTYHELWRLLAERGRRERLRVLREGTDAIFDWDDPLPFLVEHHVQVPWLLLRSLVEGRPWLRVDFNIGKLVEAGGD
ncbi:ATP-grasp enzyme [Marmoricola sp. Leaf446]|uniref:ATP-grasp enzyme n=1 Tax=Marmoricola sp. Leaf446 TaxID=1736379 RepID=UPI0006F9F2F3|nr:ATP-grasp enzyme [Marmoricola sp. Leaf446]KQT90817.1 ATP-grasp enzyme [Marmoricola sp. Leaf446]